jgi:tetratricopeptide (TPR) repeat protein
VRISYGWAALPVAVALLVAVSAVAGRGTPTAAWRANTGAIAQSRADAAASGDDRQALAAGAEAAFEQALAIAPNDVPSLRRLGLLELQEDRHVEAAVHLRRAFANDPTNRTSAKGYGLAAMWTGDLTTAVPLLADAPNIVAELNAWTHWRTTRAEPGLALQAARASLAIDPGQEDVRVRVRDLERAASVAASARP